MIEKAREKKVLILSLLLFAVTATALYVLRTELIIRAFNISMDQFEIQIEKLQGMELGWSGIKIDELTFTAGVNAKRQYLRGISIHYSLMKPAVSSIVIDNGKLSVPEFRRSGADSPQLISENLKQLAALPLDSVAIETLQVAVQGDNQVFQLDSLRWKKSTLTQKLSFVSGDQHLNIKINDLSEQTLVATLRSVYQRENSLSMDLTLIRRGANYNVEMTGVIDIGALYRQLESNQQPQNHRQFKQHPKSLLPQLISLPEEIEDISGRARFQVTGKIPDQLGTPIQESFSISIAPDTRLSLRYREQIVPQVEVDINAALTETVQLQLRWIDESLLEFTSPRIATDLQESYNGLTASATLLALSCRWQTGTRCAANFNGTLTAPAFTHRQMQLANLDTRLEGAFTLDKNLLSFRISPGELLSVSKLLANDLEMAELKIKNASPLAVNYNFETDAATINLDTLTIETAQFKTPGFISALNLDFTNIDITRQQGFSAVTKLKAKMQKTRKIRDLTQTQSSMKKSAIQAADEWLPDFVLDASMQLRDQALAMDAQLLSDRNHPLLKLDISHNLQNRTGSATIMSLDTTFDNKHNRLSKYFSKWPLNFDIQSGTAKLQAQLRWDTAKPDAVINGTLSQRLSELTGYYQDYVFVGLSAGIDARILSPTQIVNTAPSKITLKTLDLGVPVKNLSASVSFDSGKAYYQLHRFQADLLGGRASADNFIFQPQKEDNRLLLNIDNIDIEKIMQQAAYSNVEGTGKISGTLPILISLKEVKIENGSLGALQPGGVIRYHDQEGVLAGTNPAMKVVSDALSNYHYDTLQTDAQYTPDGDLKLAIKMRGVNPDMNQGQRINLNLNISDNIPALLKSLQTSRAITDVLEKALEK
ncbi:MAG: YdbH domain-containing protein [Exilibacterium sp.]